MEEFVIIATSIYKKDHWTRTISGLFVETCCDFRRIFESHVTKINGQKNQIRKNQRKERQKKQARKFLTTITIVKRIIERELVKHHPTSFISIWSFTIVKKIRDRFHCNFKEGMRSHLARHRGVNLGEIINAQKQAQQQSGVQMHKK